MPQIIVVADALDPSGAAQVMFRERVTRRDFESGHFATQLAERLGWAVGDAHAVEHDQPENATAVGAGDALDRGRDTGQAFPRKRLSAARRGS